MSFASKASGPSSTIAKIATCCAAMVAWSAGEKSPGWRLRRVEDAVDDLGVLERRAKRFERHELAASPSRPAPR